jgi:hypothetical protein
MTVVMSQMLWDQLNTEVVRPKQEMEEHVKLGIHQHQILMVLKSVMRQEQLVNIITAETR